MKVTFKKAGKYKSDRVVVAVSEEDVKAKKVFNIYDSNAIEFVGTGSAEQYVEKEKPKAEAFEKPQKVKPKTDKK